MMRKMVIALAAGAVVIAGSTFGASARGMGHGGSGGGLSRAAFAHTGGTAHGNRLDFRHRFHRNRFAFFGVGVPYRYDDGCYTRILTPYGRRWRSVCY
jgi:hypothetical protein